MFGSGISLQSLIRKRRSMNKSGSRDRESDRLRVDFQRKRKLDQPSIDTNNGTEMKRRKIGAINEAPDGNLDRISDLPEPIIHHIFAFLKCAKDAARTTILCKKWKNTFGSYLTFDFDQRWFRGPKGAGKHNRIKSRELKKKKFRAYVDRALETRIAPAPCIDKFRLYVTNVDSRLKDSMEKWIRSALVKKTKELVVNVNTKGKHFILPGEVLLSKSIASLKISGYVFFGHTPISMANLRELSIKDTLLINNDIIKKFEKGCPLIEDLRLVCCSDISKVAISSLLKLRRVEVHECGRVDCIEISAPGLECFLYHGQKDQECKIILKGSGNLKCLNLKDSKMTDNVFQDLASKSPLLEKLVLQKCANLERLTFLSETLRSLELVQCAKLKEVIIDAPNLSSLSYSGNGMPLSAVNVFGLREAKFVVDSVMRTNQCMAKYKKFFQHFDGSKGFKLIVYSKQSMTIYEDPREVYLFTNFVGTMELTVSLASVVKTVDNWLRESHGNNILLVSPSSELINLLQTKVMEREDNPSCCGFYSNKCWRHYIDGVEIIPIDGLEEMHFGFKWKPRRTSTRH